MSEFYIEVHSEKEKPTNNESSLCNIIFQTTSFFIDLNDINQDTLKTELARLIRQKCAYGYITVPHPAHIIPSEYWGKIAYFRKSRDKYIVNTFNPSTSSYDINNAEALTPVGAANALIFLMREYQETQ